MPKQPRCRSSLVDVLVVEIVLGLVDHQRLVACREQK